MLSYFRQNKLFTKCLSGLIPGDSCFAQLLSIIHEIYKKVDFWPTAGVRDVLVDISKAFDLVYHESLIFKLQSYGINGSILRVLKIS